MPRLVIATASALLALTAPAVAEVQWGGPDGRIVIDVVPSARTAARSMSRIPIVETAAFGTAVAIRNGNIRRYPNTGGEILGYMTPGLQMQVTGKVRGLPWFEIEYQGAKAYVSSGLIEGRPASAGSVQAEAPVRRVSRPVAPKETNAPQGADKEDVRAMLDRLGMLGANAAVEVPDSRSGTP